MKENTFLFFSAPICCRDFTARVRETRKPLNHGFATLNLGEFCAVIVADVFNKNKPSFYQH